MIERLLYHWPYRSDAEPVILGGCARSGTTLLRVLLDGHSQLSCGPETNLFLSPRLNLQALTRRYGLPADKITAMRARCRSHAEFIETFLAWRAQQEGKPRWAEKTPSNVMRIRYVFRHFPRARFVHVIRDGRDVACSIRRYAAEFGKSYPFRRVVAHWKKEVSAGLADTRVLPLRYEELVRAPEETLRRLLASLGLPWEDGLPGRLDRPITPSSVGRWRAELTGEEAAAFTRHAGPLLARLGYRPA